MKKAWQVLGKDWPNFAFWQKIGWVLFFWVLFPLLIVAVKYGSGLQDKVKDRRRQLDERKRRARR